MREPGRNCLYDNGDTLRQLIVGIPLITANLSLTIHQETIKSSKMVAVIMEICMYDTAERTLSVGMLLG